MSTCKFPLLEQAAGLVDAYDPLLLLTLAMDDETLRVQTCFGERLLQQLSPLLDRRSQLLQEAREMLSSHDGWFCLEMMRRVVGATKEAKVAVDSKQKKLFDGFIAEGSLLSHPTLLQMEYVSGARKHFLAGSWVDALHVEMQEMVVRCRTKEDEDGWMKEAAKAVLSLDFKKAMYAAAWMRGKRGAGPMQVIEFPNFLQRVHKLYVDWDKKLSDVKARTHFLESSSSSGDGTTTACVVQRQANVQRIRQLALRTPCAIVKLLRRAGAEFLHTGDEDDGVIKVVVKEGTRKLTASPSQNEEGNSKQVAAADDRGGEEDWKISFHFVFQVLMTSTQFKVAYTRMAEAIQKSEDLQDLAVALNLADESDEAENMRKQTEAMKDPTYGALVGMDMHPKQNAFQGLACMGSRKKQDLPRNQYIGCMLVSMDGGQSRWMEDARDGGKSSSDDFMSTASTVTSNNVDSMASVTARVAGCSFLSPAANHVAAGYSSREMHLHRFNSLLQRWVEASIIMPSSSCVGFRINLEGITTADTSSSGSSSSLTDRLLELKSLDAAVSRMTTQMLLLDPSSSSAAAAASEKMHCSKKRNLSQRQQQMPLIHCIATNADDELWKKLLYSSSGLQWFRDAFGGTEAVRSLFQEAYLNIQNISKPAALASALRAAEGGGGAKCAPWAIIRLAESKACICSMSLMQVPFKGFKCHKRNGVVFCFFGNRVFVTCMDDECRTILARRKGALFSLAKELENIHLGGYDECMTLKREDFYGAVLGKSVFASSACMQRNPGDQLLLRREAEKRWKRVMQQGGTRLHWREEQQQRLREGKMVFASVEADADSREDLRKIRKVPSSYMCNSFSEERTWVELSREVLQECVSQLQQNQQQQLQKQQQQKQKAGREGQHEKRAAAAVTCSKYMFKEKGSTASAASKKKGKAEKKYS